MKKGNVTILASIFVMALVAAGVGAGSMAYFSDVETADIGQVYATTLDMQIWDGSKYTDGVISISPASPLNPGDTFTIDVWLKNVGTSDIRYVFASFRDLWYDGGTWTEAEWSETTEGLHLIKNIVLESIYEKSPSLVSGELNNDFTVVATANSFLQAWGAPEDDSISLHDLYYYAEPGGGSALTSFRFHAGDEDYGGSPRHLSFCYLPQNSEVNIKFIFKLDEDTKNYAQGDRFGFDLVFIGSNLLTPDASLTP